jgi:hypothetical protein
VQNLLSFLPAECLPLVIILVAFGIMLGLVRLKTGIGIIVGFLLSILLAPMIGAVLDQLPWWLNLLVLAFTGIAFVQAFASIFIGSRASDTMAGSLAADMVRFVIRALFFPLRMVAAGISAVIRHVSLRGY